MLYDLARALMFRLDAETSHELALGSMNMAASLGLPRLLGATQLSLPVKVMGIRFPNHAAVRACQG